MIERLLFRKVDLWVLLLLLVAGIAVSIWFGWRVSKLQDSLVLGRVDRLVQGTSSLPDTAVELYSSLTGPPSADLLAWSQRFEGESGLGFHYAPGTRPDLGYVLINRFDGDTGRAVSDLVDLNSQEKVYSWSFDVDEVWPKTEFRSNLTNLPVDRGNGRFLHHAILLEDASLVVQSFTPLLRFDHCGQLLWAQPADIFHHSVELDLNGDLWVPTIIEPKTVDIGNWSFEDNGIAFLHPDGKLLFNRSITRILDENGLGMYVFGRGVASQNPIHVNDIQPVPGDGALWRKGDVFLSLRNQSMLLLYRPSTNEVLWYRVGPWMQQHDVDVLDDHRISVFDNHTRTKFNTLAVVDETNDWLVIDVISGEVDRPFHDAFVKLDIRTPTEGQAHLVSEDELMVEETDYGRLMQFDRSGNVIWQFINRARNGKVYKLSWSRSVPRELGDAVRESLAERRCDG